MTSKVSFLDFQDYFKERNEQNCAFCQSQCLSFSHIFGSTHNNEVAKLLESHL